MTEGWVEIKVALIALLLAMLWWLEGAAPLFLERRDRSRRLARHLFLAVFNGILVVPFLSVAAWLTSTLWFREHGLLAWLSLPLLIETFLAVVLIDLWMYAWHRANHSMPLLWRFHRVHYSDPELDSTSAFRFHTGEIVLSAVFRLALIPLLSIQLWHLLL
jgi:sterol desaturase/sphingolipid hydroxylase (fatty acid hydroxylase superfamily)